MNFCKNICRDLNETSTQLVELQTDWNFARNQLQGYKEIQSILEKNYPTNEQSCEETCASSLTDLLTLSKAEISNAFCNLPDLVQMEIKYVNRICSLKSSKTLDKNICLLAENLGKDQTQCPKYVDTILDFVTTKNT